VINFARDYLGGTMSEKEMRQRGFNPKNHEDVFLIDEFKQKIITLLLSLLEGESNLEIIDNMSV
jgi:hypothetical protein